MMLKSNAMMEKPKTERKVRNAKSRISSSWRELIIFRMPDFFASSACVRKEQSWTPAVRVLLRIENLDPRRCSGFNRDVSPAEHEGEETMKEKHGENGRRKDNPFVWGEKGDEGSEKCHFADSVVEPRAEDSFEEGGRRANISSRVQSAEILSEATGDREFTRRVQPRLNHLEEAELWEYEAAIHGGLQTFFEVGTALMAIREKHLYRDHYRTFALVDKWMESKWKVVAPGIGVLFSKLRLEHG
jgi:hypothetical protein